MIAQLKGKLLEKTPPSVLLDVHDVGYEILASMNTIFRLPDVGHTVTLYTHLVVREDAHTLFGFFDKAERELFVRLIKVNGIGPKMALAILSSMEGAIFAQYVSQNDVAALTKIPGVGRKTAERLIIEMRDKFDTHPHTQSFMSVSGAEQDAISALIALGYKDTVASKTVKGFLEEAEDSETLIRLSLKALNKL
ncbi:MAG: Holliday junction branch migration protein RuvA [Gammaproteobacteria bacterium CG11_big_fil_rev_8_21_14_0_20_46_22]|nr:MAG: Holliday junction branch migration protein RuvA [Gammaproteobacteria bacterium CG12_big_fil_rev_8_21_14_0_65_46_12]PIR11442.1 MAG: Holliday junction branch migration protein RuvA [Gammaproteobacteria bacterium CG11_big_fil_rev_8_21_14_0_20_46_22]